MNPKFIKLQLQYSINEEFKGFELLFDHLSKIEFEKEENYKGYLSLKEDIEKCSGDFSPFVTVLKYFLRPTFLNPQAINFNKDDVFSANFIKLSDSDIIHAATLFNRIGVLFVLRDKVWLDSNNLVYIVEPVIEKVKEELLICF